MRYDKQAVQEIRDLLESKGIYIDTSHTDTNTPAPLSRGQSGGGVFVSIQLVSI